MSLLLGCIADDFTGATDLANTLTRGGMASVVLPGTPRAALAVPDADAIVIALKSRSAPAAAAVRMSLEALAWLKNAGAPQFYFKYCSTFDSTDTGNIGPVAEALLDALGASFAIACPAYPSYGRTIFRGYLFVGDVLLSESGMREHPLTPMTDPSLVRVLQRQSRGHVGLIPYDIVRQGTAAIRKAAQRLCAEGVRLAIADALVDEDLIALGEADAESVLLTGGSGLALGLPENFRRAGCLPERPSTRLPTVDAPAAVLAGSCSTATRRQVASMKAQCESFEIDPLELHTRDDVVARALAWARPRLGTRPILLYSTAEPDAVAKAQTVLGRECAGALVEDALGAIAKDLVAMGVRRFVVAGGETSGAVVTALGVTALRVGVEIEPGVPWTASLGEPPLVLALKSGNFGCEDFFMKALQ
jgi:uncharacterized protein YgbK (DUF1537 family)